MTAAQDINSSSITFGHGETILLADNSTGLLNLGRSLLSKLNYKVVTANNENQVLEQFTTSGQKIDLMILDTQIPRRNGQDILKQVRSLQPQTKTLFYTVCDWLMDCECHKKIDHEPVITKPYSVVDLSKTIDQTLNNL